MKMKWLLPLFSVLVMAGCTSVKDPEFRRVENFKVKDFGLQDVTVGFQVTYFNPNKFGVTVKDAVADIYMDSVYVGKFTQDNLVEVGSNSNFSIPLSGKLALGTALKMDLQNIGSRKIYLKADGSVRVGKAGVFVTKPFDYEGNHSLNEISFK